jgi:hypothetical protein
MAMAYDAARGEVVLFGGRDGTQFLGDTWTWNGTAWTEEHPDTSPSPRVGMGMAYDAARSLVVLFGGCCDDQGELNDTWTWDGTTWTEQHPSRSPNPRDSFGMAYHALSRTVVIFGGYGGALDPTWTWDGTTWTEQAPGRSPHYAYGVGMTEYAGEVALVGGEYYLIEIPHYQPETWIWDGTDWNLPSQSHPFPRAFVGLAPGVAGHQLVLFGGERADAQLGDTWAWDGTRWTRRRPPTSPPPRWSMGMVYDEARGRVVMFGGEYLHYDYRYLGDTWTWDGSTWTRAG